MSKRIILGAMLVLGIFFKAEVIGATTTVSGTQSGTWKLSSGPYVVTADVTIPVGSVLVIEPGVEVKFATNTSLIAYGVLMAVGTPNGTITFTSNNYGINPGDWSSIKLSGNGANGSEISYCLIEYGKQAVYLENVRNVKVTYNIIRKNKGNDGKSGNIGQPGGVGCGIYISESNNNIIGTNTISNNTGGCGGSSEIYQRGGEGGVGAAIYLFKSGTNTIVGNTTSQNIGGQGGIGGTNGSGGGGGIGCGIFLSTSINNTLSKNKISENTGGQGGIHGNGGSDGVGGQGYGIYIDSASFNNTIDIFNTYNEEPIFYYYGVTTPMTIENQNLTLVGSGSTNLGRIILIECSNFTIQNNSIVGGIGENGKTGNYGTSGTPGGIGCGIYLSSSINNTILGNTILQNTGGQGGPRGAGGSGGDGVGIYLISSSNNKITTGNIIRDNQGGIGNPNGNGVGIYCKSSLISELSDNNIYNNQTYNLQTDGTQTAEYNWWGADPPATYTFSGNIDYEPWLTGSVAKITIVPSSGTVGTFVTVSGEDFGSTEIIQIDFGTTQTITTVTTNASGTFTTVFTIDTQPYGTTSIIATGLNSGKTASNFFCTLPKILFVAPTKGTVGTMVTIRGNGFGAYESIHIDFGKTQTISFTSTYAEGSFTTTFTIDTQSYGTTTIKVIGVNTQAEVTDYFFILPTIVLVTPYIGTVGSFVTIAGNGFGKLEAIQVDFGATLNICIVSSNPYGTFSAVFTVNTQPCGTTSIVASGVASGTKVFWYGFKIVPKITVLPTSGQVGSFVTVTGNGFGSSELIIIEFGTTHTITTVSTYAAGEFQTIFTVNSQPIGTTTIIALGMATQCEAMVRFVILPLTTLKITPATQNIAVNSTFTCQAEIEDVERLRGAELHLSFNPNILEVIDIGTGTFPPNGWVMQNKYDNIKGEIDYTVGLISGSATGSGVLCEIKFKAISGGTSAVIFDFVKPNRITTLLDIGNNEIPFNKEEAMYQIITGIEIKPKDKEIRADETIDYTCLASCGGLELEVTGSTTFTANGGGSFTLNTFHAKYMGTYTIQGEYLGFIGTTSVIIQPGTPTTLVYVSGNNQVNTCTFTLKDPFIVKVVDKYENPCRDVEVNWEILSTPSGATGYSISPTKTTTNVQGTASSFLTLGTEPPGTYTIHAISTGLNGSPCVFTAHSLRRFGNIAGFSMLDLGTITLGTCSDIQVRIVELGTTTTTNDSSYFIFENIPVGTYTLTFDTWGASPATKTNICISPTQFEDTTYIGTITLLAGDVNNDGNVNIGD
ncbi:MAG: NosD domain-containing protein [bacterium]